MKKVLILVSFLLAIGFVSAVCDIEVTMVNQDPYPAVPGEYVKLVFQVEGIENPECIEVYVELIPGYPLVLDPNQTTKVSAKAGTFVRDFGSHLIVPFKVRVDEDAIEGETSIEVMTSQGVGQISTRTSRFNLTVEDPQTDFEVYIKDYDYGTNTITFELLNIGESDVEALTVEIPDQENIEIKGPYRDVVGDLDSNEYTTADFEAIPSGGEIRLTILYTDTIGTRRSLEKIVVFDSKYFTNRKADQGGLSIFSYVIIFLILVVIIYWLYTRYKKKKQHRSHH